MRFLNDGSFRRVGGDREVKVNVRILSATHRDLEKMVSEGLFREDLFYRLNVLNVEVPPLRERGQDILLLARYFMQQACAQIQRPVCRLAPGTYPALLGNRWPGTVRQLQNIVEQTVVLSTTPLVPATLVQKALQNELGNIVPLETARKNFERDYLVKLLKATNGSVTQAARLAQRNRTEFYKLLQRHLLTPALFKDINTQD